MACTCTIYELDDKKKYRQSFRHVNTNFMQIKQVIFNLNYIIMEIPLNFTLLPSLFLFFLCRVSELFAFVIKIVAHIHRGINSTTVSHAKLFL